MTLAKFSTNQYQCKIINFTPRRKIERPKYKARMKKKKQFSRYLLCGTEFANPREKKTYKDVTFFANRTFRNRVSEHVK